MTQLAWFSNAGRLSMALERAGEIADDMVEQRPEAEYASHTYPHPVTGSDITYQRCTYNPSAMKSLRSRIKAMQRELNRMVEP